MLLEEFEDISGQYPCSMVYNLIEAEYRDMPEDVTKEEFCRRFMVNQDGIASRVQRTANKLWRDAMDGTQDDARRIAELERQVLNLRNRLACQTGWRVCWPDDIYSDGMYDDLRHWPDTVLMPDDDAKKLVHKLLGFEMDRITILRGAPVFERHIATGVIREAGQTERLPRWANDGWNCVTFKCCNLRYQLHDGTVSLLDQIVGQTGHA